MSRYDEAKAKLEAEVNAGSFGQKGKAMAPAVKNALLEFCRQSEDFAEKVAHGGSFEECMKAVAKGVGGSISDLEAYKRAVKHYAPGCSVAFKMEIVECGAGKKNEAPEPTHKAAVIDLTAFL